MSMSSKSKSGRSTENQATAIQAEAGDVPVANSARDEEIRRRHTKSILNAANIQAANWTIVSRRNANSTEGCCGTRSAG
jgi:hypothetical protein